jgi:hypothetical protein
LASGAGGFGEARARVKDVAVEVWVRIKMGASSAGAAATANTYRQAATDLANGATAPLTSWGTLRDAVAGTGEEGAAALDAATVSADQLSEAMGRAGGAAGTAQDRVLTGWRAVSDALQTYATEALNLGKGLGQSLVSAFQSAESAFRTFVTTGKLDFKSLVSSILADLAVIAARRFILGPIANGLSTALGGLAGGNGMFANILHTGGLVGAPAPLRMVPAMAFASAPRFHNGGWAGLRPDEVPAILQRGERVLSREETRAYDRPARERAIAPIVNISIQTRDAESFRQSRTQVASDIARAVALGRRGM